MASGGRALPLQMDVRHDDQIDAAAAKAADTFGGIDILVNNAGAISLTGTLATPMKRFDLMFGVNVRGTYACSRALIPYLRRSAIPHILTLSPPLSLNPMWFRDHCAYTISKYGMSMCVLGMAEEFRDAGIGVNALWPRTTIATSAVKNLLGGEKMVAMLGGAVSLSNCRKPEIVADAAHAILVRRALHCTGNFFIDEEVLAEEGVTDFSSYSYEPGAVLLPDLFLG